MAQLYADEDFSYPATVRLRELGHDVLTAAEAGQANSKTTDEQILAFAINHGRAVLTFNRRHFVHLHSVSSSHTGIVVCSRDPDVVALTERIDRSLREHETLEDRLIRVDRPHGVQPSA
jgi:hypothetical protein